MTAGGRFPPAGVNGGQVWYIDSVQDTLTNAVQSPRAKNHYLTGVKLYLRTLLKAVSSNRVTQLIARSLADGQTWSTLVTLMHPVHIAAVVAFEIRIALSERTGRHLDVIATTLAAMDRSA